MFRHIRYCTVALLALLVSVVVVVLPAAAQGQRTSPDTVDETTDDLFGSGHLSGAWVYHGRGKATIEHWGDRVKMKLTWTPSDIPGPHYEVDALLQFDGVMTGAWVHLSARPGSALLPGGYFEAKVSPDGNSISVSNTEDNGHNWNSIVLTRAPSATE